MPELYTSPTRIPVPGGKLIEEHVGRVNSGDERVSIARMTAPANWSETLPDPRVRRVDPGPARLGPRRARRRAASRSTPARRPWCARASGSATRAATTAPSTSRSACPHSLPGPSTARTSRERRRRRRRRRAPKALLHDHLDGGLRPQTIMELAAEIGLRGAARDRAGALGEWFRGSADSGSLDRYLETFAHTVAVMQTAEGLRRVAARVRPGPRRRRRRLCRGPLRARAAPRSAA